MEEKKQGKGPEVTGDITASACNDGLCSPLSAPVVIEWKVVPVPSVQGREIDENGVLLPRGDKSRFVMDEEAAIKECMKRAKLYLKRHGFMLVSEDALMHKAAYLHSLIDEGHE
jgi:hypothetical protein